MRLPAEFENGSLEEQTMTAAYLEPFLPSVDGSDVPQISEAQREQLGWFWSYRDVLALALATAHNIRFTASPTRWNQTISAIKVQIHQDAPLLLEDVLFDRRDPATPCSAQVESFLASMRRSGVLRWSDEFDDTYEIAPEDKEDIVNNQSSALRQYDQVISQMAEAIDASLAQRLNGRG